MSTSPNPSDRSHRTSALVRDPDVAAQVVIDLTDRGIDADRVASRALDPAEGAQSPRATGEDDLAFTEATGKTIGAGFVVGALIGALAGAIGVSLLFEPPWASPLAAGITLAVAIGVGYLAGGMGLLQAGISRTGETGGEPRTATRPRSGDRGVVEVVVDAASAEEADLARRVFAEHNTDISD
jgi:hypothetical protein